MAFETRYIYIHNEDKSRDYLRARPCVREGSKRVERPWDAKYAVKVLGQDIKVVPREFEGAVDRARFLLRERPLGTVILFQRLRSDNRTPTDTVKFRKIQTTPPVADTPGVEGIDRFVGWVLSVKRRSDHVRWAGICVCKPNSDHADCAAVDMFATDKFMRRAKLETLQNVSYYRTKYNILYREICFPSPGQCLFYSGDFHAHLHLSVNGGIDDAACR